MASYCRRRWRSRWHTAGVLSGVLVVGRYAAYNAAWCKIQYCYAHLPRDLQDIEKDFPDQAEVRAFVGGLA